MKKKILALLACTAFFALPARPRGRRSWPDSMRRRAWSFAAGNIFVAESGQATANTGRISIIDRATATRRTLIDGLPSGLNASGGESSPSGPSGIALANGTIYISIGAGDASGPGPAPAARWRILRRRHRSTRRSCRCAPRRRTT